MLSQVSKTLLKNVIRHTDAHNKVVEECDMWRQRGKEKGSKDDNYSFLKDNRVDMRYEFPTSRNRRVAHMDDEESGSSTHWMRQLYKAEENDQDRWGHNGYKQMHPADFESTDGSSSDSEPNHSRNRRESRKQKKKENGRSRSKKKHRHRSISSEHGRNSVGIKRLKNQSHDDNSSRYNSDDVNNGKRERDSRKRTRTWDSESDSDSSESHARKKSRRKTSRNSVSDSDSGEERKQADKKRSKKKKVKKDKKKKKKHKKHRKRDGST